MIILDEFQFNKIVADKKFFKILLKYKVLSVKDVDNYSALNEERKTDICDGIWDLLRIYAPFSITYSAVDEQFPDDCQIFGVRGMYILYYPEEGMYKFFTNKRMAIKEANKSSKTMHDIWNNS